MIRGRVILTALSFCVAGMAAAQDSIRIATFNASLSRSGPGVLINRLAEGGDDQIRAVADIIRRVRPDILLINEFDHDPVGLATDLFTEILRTDGPTGSGIDFAHSYDPPPNTGYLSGHDLNADGKERGPEDAFGYGKFPGQYGMLLLSRYPIDAEAARDFTRLRWRDMPGHQMPVHAEGSPFPSEAAAEILRLSSKGHWDVPVETPLGRVHILASHPTPPVFDGPEDFNGLRNADEIRFWTRYLDGSPILDGHGRQAPRADVPFVLLGDLNNDPADGEGIKDAIAGLLDHPLVQDPLPASKGAVDAATLQKGANATQTGDPAHDTADWNDDRGPGNLRVDYALPSSDLTVVGAGVFWPTRSDRDFSLIGTGKPASSDHRLVWVDVAR